MYYFLFHLPEQPHEVFEVTRINVQVEHVAVTVEQLVRWEGSHAYLNFAFSSCIPPSKL